MPLEPLDEVELPAIAYAMVVTDNEAYAYALNATTLYQLLTSDMSIVDSVVLGAGNNDHLAVSHDGSYVYVCDYDNVYKVQTSDMTLALTCAITGRSGSGVAVDSSGTYVYAATVQAIGGLANVYKIQTSNMSIVGTYNWNDVQGAMEIAISSDDLYVYSSGPKIVSPARSATIRKIRTSNMTLVTSYTNATYVEQVGSIQYVGGYVYVADYYAKTLLKFSADLDLIKANTGYTTGPSDIQSAVSTRLYVYANSAVYFMNSLDLTVEETLVNSASRAPRGENLYSSFTDKKVKKDKKADLTPAPITVLFHGSYF